MSDLKTVNIESDKDPAAIWRFSNDPTCTHENVGTFTVGTYRNGDTAGKVTGKRCRNRDCKALLY